MYKKAVSFLYCDLDVYRTQKLVKNVKEESRTACFTQPVLLLAPCRHTTPTCSPAPSVAALTVTFTCNSSLGAEQNAILQDQAERKTEKLQQRIRIKPKNLALARHFSLLADARRVQRIQ